MTMRAHVVQFYDDDRMLTISAADFLADGIAAGEPAVAFATPSRRDAMRSRLRDRGLDMSYLERQSRLTILDARAALAAFMVGGMPDAHKFRHSVGAAVGRLCVADHGATVRAFGEMVSLLWQAGNTRAAFRLEELWNALAASHPLSLLCGYAGGAGPAATGAPDRGSICRLHTHVLDAGGAMQPIIDASMAPYRLPAWYGIAAAPETSSVSEG